MRGGVREGGFTLVEMLLALLVLGLMMSVVLPAIGSNAAINTRSELRTQASLAAQRVLDEARTRDPVSLPMSGSAPPALVNVGGRTFQVTLSYCTVPAYCSGSARQLRAGVSLNGADVLGVETVYTSVNSVVNANR